MTETKSACIGLRSTQGSVALLDMVTRTRLDVGSHSQVAAEFGP